MINRGYPLRGIEIEPISEAAIRSLASNNAARANRQSIANLIEQPAKERAVTHHTPEEIIAVLLQIAIHISDLIPDNQIETTGIILNVIQLLHASYVIQQSALPQKKQYAEQLSTEARRTGNPAFIAYDNMAERLSQITITDNTLTLWEELAVWMQGLYRKTADKIRRQPGMNEPARDQHGFYPRVDMEDATLFMLYNITKMDIAMPFNRAARTIRLKTDLYRGVVPHMANRPISPSLAIKNNHFAPPPAPGPGNTQVDNPGFICVITFDFINVAAICTLDGKTYEKSYVETYIKAEKQSPTRVSLPDNQSVVDVILPNHNLQLALQYFKQNSKADDCFICPLTKAIMKNAMYCLLDGISYEEEDIRRYLDTHGETPGKIALPKDKKSMQVLVPNLNLRDAIEYIYPQLNQKQVKTL